MANYLYKNFIGIWRKTIKVTAIQKLFHSFKWISIFETVVKRRWCQRQQRTQGSHSDWKTWKNGKVFSSQGKVREFWTDWKSQGKVRENHTKYWKTQGIWDQYYLIFLVIFKWTLVYLLKWIKFSVKKTKHYKNTGNLEKNTGKVREKSGNLVSPEKWEPWNRQFMIVGSNVSKIVWPIIFDSV